MSSGYGYGAGSRSAATKSYEENLESVISQLRNCNKVIVLSGAGMSTAAGIPDFRSPGGLYGSSAALLDKFTYLGDDASRRKQRAMLEQDIKAALTLRYFRVNPLTYHEMRRGFILGIGANQWKLSIGHVFPQILAANGKLLLLASQNIDGLDHKVVQDKSKLYNPHGLMSALVSEPLTRGQSGDQANITLTMDPKDPIYQRYVELVKSNIKDIYQDRKHRHGKSSHLWPSPSESTPITLDMFGDLLPPTFHAARDIEKHLQEYSVKPGSVMFDRTLWTTNARHQPCNAFSKVSDCDMVMVMGTSLSGLTIDAVAHEARCPRVVFDMTDAPVQSIRSEGIWRDHDCFMQGALDKSILDVLHGMNWLNQIFDDMYLQHLCLQSLSTLVEFIKAKHVCEDQVTKVQGFIEKEKEREKQFYQDE
eukprot:TRINITY_DN100203_c0_g1_i1.p1 TRINITY_DN100203_c0_g1~~TRINITY_DN100203_c0_g1_i1.p1  ORF type:complete len:421 (-),score=65.95 TRINITY_DN100203_c0_g1_i1:37-1299(-)